MGLMKKLTRVLFPVKKWSSPAADENAERSKLRELQEALDYQFEDVNLLLESLKHRSYVYSRDESGTESNERLEFLGDAVLDLVVTEYLYRKFREKREGDLTQIKSLIVSKMILARKARELGLGRYLLLSKEEELSGGRDRTSIIGDTYEALLGAIYLDGSLKAVRRFLDKQILRDIDKLASNEDYLNFKSALLEHVQSEGKGQPEYMVDAEEGPDHKKMFTVEVAIQGESMGRGTGRSKKQAEQRAAREALKRMGVV